MTRHGMTPKVNKSEYAVILSTTLLFWYINIFSHRYFHAGY